jgi:hypothetical protein
VVVLAGHRPGLRNARRLARRRPACRRLVVIRVDLNRPPSIRVGLSRPACNREFWSRLKGPPVASNLCLCMVALSLYMMVG